MRAIWDRIVSEMRASRLLILLCLATGALNKIFYTVKIYLLTSHPEAEMVISIIAPLRYFVMSTIVWAGQWPRRKLKGTKSARIQGESIRPSVCPSILYSPRRGMGQLIRGTILGGGYMRTDVWTYKLIDSTCIIQDFASTAAAQNDTSPGWSFFKGLHKFLPSSGVAF